MSDNISLTALASLKWNEGLGIRAYSDWAYKVKAFLQGHLIWHLVMPSMEEFTKEKDDTKEMDKERKAEASALMVLQLTIPPSYHNQIEDKTF